MSATQAGWATSGDLSIAYEATGSGPPDVVSVPGMLNTILASRVYPPVADLDREIARFARLIKLDKRGTGMSDRLPRGLVPAIEERGDDIRAVMDAVDSERACIFASADGGPVAIMFAATYPERVASLVLLSTSPRAQIAPDWPWGATPERRDVLLDLVRDRWGTGVLAGLTGVGGEEELALLERLAGTPAVIEAAIETLWETDVRDVLSSVTARTLVVSEPDDPLWPAEAAAYLAVQIPNAELLEMPRGRSTIFGEPGVLVAAVRELTTGERSIAEVDRVLTTVLFTDIVASTERVSTVGDRRWRELLDEHDRAIRAALDRHRGVEVNTTGDGFLASFDGPARAIRCAHEIAAQATRLELEVRAGIHTGECERRGNDLSGIAVHIGARVAALADSQEILVTGTVRDLVAGSGIEFEDRGLRALKGVPGEWQVLAVSSLG